MDTGTGDLRYLNEFKSVKGKLVEWKIGEEVIVKDCKFVVKEIRNYPDNEIVLKGIPNDDVPDLVKELSEKVEGFDDDRKPLTEEIKALEWTIGCLQDGQDKLQSELITLKEKYEKSGEWERRKNENL